MITDGQAYDIRHPDLMMVGRHSTIIGLTGDPGQTFYELPVEVDLLHVIRLEPLETAPPAKKDGA